MAGHLLTFCSWVFIVVFGISSASKAIAWDSFVRNIQDLGPVPKKWSRALVWPLVIAECLVAGSIACGGDVLAAGFVFGVFLLSAFSVFLGYVLAMRKRVSCNCFGTSSRIVTGWDLARNCSLITLGVAALSLLEAGYEQRSSLLSSDGALAAIVAALVVIVLVNMDLIHFLPRYRGYVPEAEDGDSHSEHSGA